jgi:hypothetical protein
MNDEAISRRLLLKRMGASGLLVSIQQLLPACAGHPLPMVGVPVAAGVLYLFFGLLLSPMFASATMTFSSVSVISNALRLQRVAL